MNLEQFALLAEIVGSAAVVASLLYLVRQVRLNTDMLRFGNENDVVTVNMALCAPLIADAEVAQLWIKAEREFDTLSEADRMRMVLQDWTAIQAWHNWFNLRQRNLVSDPHWKQLEYVIPLMCRRQSLREAWRLYGDSFSPDFQAFIRPFIE